MDRPLPRPTSAPYHAARVVGRIVRHSKTWVRNDVFDPAGNGGFNSNSDSAGHLSKRSLRAMTIGALADALVIVASDQPIKAGTSAAIRPRVQSRNGFSQADHVRRQRRANHIRFMSASQSWSHRHS